MPREPNVNLLVDAACSVLVDVVRDRSREYPVVVFVPSAGTLARLVRPRKAETVDDARVPRD